MEHGLTFIIIKNAFQKQGCPICNINFEEEERYLKFLLYENVNDGSTRNKIINSMGFCERHFYLMHQIEENEFKDHLGTAIIIESIMSVLEKNMEKCIEDAGNKNIDSIAKSRKIQKIKNNMLDDLSPKNNCYLCESLYTDETYYINEIIGNMYENEMAELLEHSTGFCYRHLIKAISCFNGDLNLLDDFLKLHIGRIKNIKCELQEYIRKHSYEYAKEPKGKEQYTYIEATEFLLGNKKHYLDKRQKAK